MQRPDTKGLPALRRQLLSLLLAVAAAGVSTGGVSAAEITTPDAGEVAIYRDDWGVPHIYALREEDAFFGLGYAQSEDHLDFLLNVLAIIHRRSAATAGAPAASADLASFQWRHLEKGREGWGRLSPDLKRNYTAYSRGIERYLADYPQKHPPWLPKIDPSTWVVWTRLLTWQYMIQDGLRDCTAGGVQLAAADVAGLQRTSSEMASNVWALAPWRTADSVPILLSDPHGGIDGTIFHEFRIHTPTLDAAGFAFGPLLILAHNRDVAWGMTTGGPDVSDCFAVDVDPAAPGRYRFDGKWREMIRHEATFDVKGAAPVKRTFEYTEHNAVLSPVVARKDGKAYVVSTAYMEAAGLFDEEIYRMNRARSVEDVRAANRLQGMFPQNLVATDRAGNQYYLRAGRTPRRPAGHDWTRPVSGSTSQSAWRGIHPVEDLVQVHNPWQGYLQNSNVPPNLMFGDAPGIAREDYPDYIYYDAPPFRYTMRAARAVEVLSRAYAFTVDEAKAFAVDEKWYGTEHWQGLLHTALSTQAPAVAGWKPQHREMAQRLLRFDGVASASSSSALAFYHWRTAVQEQTASRRAELDQALRGERALASEVGEALVQAVGKAADEMIKLYGGLDRQLGEVFRVGRNAERSWPLGGGVAVNASSYPECRTTDDIRFPCPLTMRAFMFGKADEKNRRFAVGGSRALRLVVLSEPLRSYTLHNYGQSSDPASPHYDDQARLLQSEGKLKSGYFDARELADHVTSARTLHTEK